LLRVITNPEIEQETVNGNPLHNIDPKVNTDGKVILINPFEDKGTTGEIENVKDVGSFIILGLKDCELIEIVAG
jgi:hypothetical protein